MRVLDLDIPNSSAPRLANGEADPSQPLMHNFYLPLVQQIKGSINEGSDVYPHVDYDHLEANVIPQLIGNLSQDEVNELRRLSPEFGRTISTAAWRDNRERNAFLAFLYRYPYLTNLIQNINIPTDLVLLSSEIHLGAEINADNFLEAKQLIDKVNLSRWSRDKSQQERQGGVSILGSVSETLLSRAFGDMIDNERLFRIGNSKVQSYGDFVLMCLPNNLWISVKSNYARERLLASGYTTDILGVGFFTDYEEFTSTSKIRNFQRVGFLAMYIPDVAITDEQIASDTSTYQQVIDFHEEQGIDLPKNINQTPFLRPLSSLPNDLRTLIEEGNVAKRTTIDF